MTFFRDNYCVTNSADAHEVTTKSLSFLFYLDLVMFERSVSDLYSNLTYAERYQWEITTRKLQDLRRFLDQNVDEPNTLENLRLFLPVTTYTLDYISTSVYQSDPRFLSRPRVPTTSRPLDVGRQIVTVQPYHQEALNNACSICLADFESSERVAMLKCKHALHAACLDLWLKVKRSCPVCRFAPDADPDAVSSGF